MNGEVSKQTPNVGVADALRALLEQIPAGSPPAERVVVRRINDREYVSRVYGESEDDYEGYHILLH